MPLRTALLVLLTAASLAVGAPPGPERRVPWTTSRVVGFPSPPPPYRAVPAFPKLKLPCPIGVVHQPGSDYLLLIHQMSAWSGRGRIVRIKDDPQVESAEELLTLDGIAYGLAFHPNFAQNGYLYVGDNGPMTGTKQTRVTRYTMETKPPYRLDPKSAKVIIAWDSDGHNGGDLAFGPDGMLYVSSGDGTSDSDTNRTGQDMTKLLAKVLRIDVDHPGPDRAYGVPKDNPFVGRPGIRPETWAYGFRNPWRLHIDRRTGDLWVGNNGQDLWEQIFLVRKGANYGWSAFEGSHPFYPDRLGGPSPHSKPIVEHHHSEARSMTGGVTYYGTKLPELRGAYIYGDWSTGRVWGVRHKDGQVTWHQLLCISPMQITGFGLDSRGELLIADHGGGYYRLEPAPRETQAQPFPTRLSETGLFESVKDHKVHPALIPYSVNAPLWSDGADKERFLALPGLSQIEFTEKNGWNFPEGAVLVKTFALGGRRIETRLLTKQVGQWYGYSYLWNEAQTDAELVPAEGKDRIYEVRDARAPGGVRRQTWRYPSRTECMVCHSRAANFVLGPSTPQMNKLHDYGNGSDNQLRVLERLGVFKVGLGQHVDEFQRLAGRARAALPRALRPVFDVVARTRALQELEKKLRAEEAVTTRLARAPSGYEKLADPSDRKSPVEARARAYLHANCAICHVQAGGGNAQMELEVFTPREKMNLLGARPLHDSFGIRDAKLVTPGSPEKSVLYQRLTRRGPGQMPPLATALVDEEAAALLAEWIKGLK